MLVNAYASNDMIGFARSITFTNIEYTVPPRRVVGMIDLLCHGRRADKRASAAVRGGLDQLHGLDLSEELAMIHTHTTRQKKQQGQQRIVEE